jgi:hypothetical protein
VCGGRTAVEEEKGKGCIEGGKRHNLPFQTISSFLLTKGLRSPVF